EYFGGILASSRSEDGKDDSGIFYVDIIKSMSSGQLKMHYIIYRTFNKYFLADETKKGINPGQEDELNRENLFIPLLGIEQQLNQDLGAVLHGLAAKKLIGGFKTQNHIDGNEIMPYLKVSPTSLGIQLFAIANNKLEKWQRFAGEDFGDFRDIILPSIYASSLDSLSEKAGFKKLDSKN
ncbi:MAG: hypothetical protein NTZ80_04365, partial [Patescibacteria group bacterium]|nr:hypothetical protein [Patescibacteria group bacterium]